AGLRRQLQVRGAGHRPVRGDRIAGPDRAGRAAADRDGAAAARGGLPPAMRLRRFRLAPLRCPACGPSLLVVLGDDEMLVRCLRCRGTPVHLSLVAAVATHVPGLARRRVYEWSTTGAALAWLRRHCGEVATSEYLDGVAPGSDRDGVRCEDVQRPSFDDGSFDLCTSTEVFEHVPDDHAGL